jgi:hypothetical protein
MPHVMTEEDIDEIVHGYRLSARYAREGGLDGVEIHGMGHGYLLGQFLSPATNHRQDQYGGSLENRLRIVKRIIDATREETGDDLIVGARINSADGGTGGLDPAAWAEISRHLEATGKLDFLSCSHGTYLNRMLIYPTSPETHGYQLEATKCVKQAVDIPVVGVGRIVRPDEAEQNLIDGCCDYIGLSRALIADPDWPAKAQDGAKGPIRPCVGANWCLESIFAHAPIACIHNPAAGKEMSLGGGTLKKASMQRRVAVVGGGPGGMQAAITAAERGHDVTLFEKQPKLGGQIRWFTRTQVRSELGGIVEFLTARLEQVRVGIRLGTAAQAGDLADFDAVVLATGSIPLRHGWSALRPERWDGPSLPGMDGPDIFTIEDVLGPNEKKLKHDVLIYDTLGGRQAVVVADHLATNGHSVHFATPLGQVSPNLAATRDWGKVYGKLRRQGVTFSCDVELKSVAGSTAVFRDVFTNADLPRAFGSLVQVVGSAANDGLMRELKGKALHSQLYMVGDCLAPRRVSDAIREGELIARAI